MPRRVRAGRRLAWFGIGVTVMALGFTVRPVHAPTWIFWTLLVLGGVALAMGAVPLPAKRSGPSHVAEIEDATARNRRVATECRRVHEALTAFVDERSHERPRSPFFTANAERMDAWREETVTRYRNELRGWISQVFREAVACGGASETARPLVDAPGPTQLSALGDLFRDAAEVLEQKRF